MADDISTETIPIFPLPNVVLFPKMRVPLHIFEPRYRSLTAQALQGDRHIGMVTVLPDHVEEMQGNPPVFSVGCLGMIDQAEELEDGRYNLILRGLSRFRIAGEEPPDPEGGYRIAVVERLEEIDPQQEQNRVRALRSRAVELFVEVVRVSAPDQADTVESYLRSDLDDEVVSNTLSASLDIAAEEKQGLLEADGVANRFERLIGVLQFRRAELEGRGHDGSRSVH